MCLPINGKYGWKYHIRDSGDTIDCSKLGRGEYSVPSITDELEFKKVNEK